MLTIERFMSIISYISAFYTNFKMDLKDDSGEPSYQLKVWYDIFKDFDEEMLVSAIKMYCKENIYPPSSPAQILSFITQKMKNVSKSGELVFEEVVEAIRDSGHDLYQVTKDYETKDKVIALTIKEMQSSFRSWFNDSEQLPYLRKDFVARYTTNLDLNVRNSVNRGNLQRLETNNIKLLQDKER